MKDFDVIIIGAGPAGCSCALSLAKSGLQIGVFDKDKFPREKTCGDGISIDSFKQLAELSPTLQEKFLQLKSTKAIKGLSAFSPKQKVVHTNLASYGKTPGFNTMRKEFDFLLFNELSQYPNIHIFQETCIRDVVFEENQVKCFHIEEETYSAKMVIGADGMRSILNKKNTSTNNNALGIRAYFKYVKTGNPSYNELHFLKEILPGYLWIFPLGNDCFNVGLFIQKKRIAFMKENLSIYFNHIIHTHPYYKNRFHHAEMIGDLKAMNIPFVSTKNKLYGDRHMLVGDAASLADAFFGQGIANALRSGQFAAKQAITCFETGDFSSKLISGYQDQLYGFLAKEIKYSKILQTLFSYNCLVNNLFYFVRKNKRFQKWAIAKLLK